MSMEVLKQNLEKKGYQVSCFETKEEAADYISSSLNGVKIGFGGSVTLDQMGLYEKLAESNEVIWHWRIPEGKTAPEVLMDARDAEVYISSVNGIAETGEIVNIDGNGNRVAATIYGHKKVYFVAGVNKIGVDLSAAMDHARNVAAPLNAKRLNKKTPCAVTGKCHDCQSPERICRALTVFWSKPSACSYEVVLVNEELGY